MDKKKFFLSLAAISGAFTGVKVAQATEPTAHDANTIHEESKTPALKKQFVLKVDFDNPENSEGVSHTSHRSHSSHKSHNSHSSHRSLAFV